MSMTLIFSGPDQQRIEAFARERGKTPEQAILDLVPEPPPVPDVSHLSPRALGRLYPTLFPGCTIEEPILSPEERKKAERGLIEFKKAMNQNRRDDEGPNARVLYPDVEDQE